jgi:hypothetical protein
MLGPYLENIELLLFESNHTDALPSKEVIGELADLAKDALPSKRLAGWRNGLLP